MRKLRGMLLAAAAIPLCSAAQVAWPADAPLPIVDAHLHYSQDAWSRFPAADILRLMDQAGVSRAVASSTPDDGTVTLHKAAPARIVPFLRPYRGSVGAGNWIEDPALAAYLEERLRSGVYRGIGEFHLWAGGAQAPNVRRVVALAAGRGLFVQVHSDAEPVRALFALDPNVKVLWAHAGMSEPPAVIGALLEQQARLWCELSFRAGDIAPGGKLEPAWRALFLRFPDRFLIGSDTYVTSRWDGYVELIQEHRRWLTQLPRAVGEAIAFRNAARLFGEGG